ncbi:MAG: glycosyltransferase [Limnoraphis robusta]|uniref:Glycosyl transferase family 1 n=1 Tax=Limnoraphis robusta CS-951 TaxID=1637645 RepID=A0A0F5YJN2_9CYAN|nr:glycosyltransferase [Limnoraphis robusta]KKD38400.1 glycosyl transferase family 1 [Limnoraphis robusta CS-951]
MKVVQTTSWYFPESSGGVEVYLDGLIQGLTSRQIENIVAAPKNGDKPDDYQYNGVEVYRYPLHPSPSLAQQREQSPPGGFEDFCQWLETQNADIYHQHSWRFGCGLHHLRYARQLGLPTVVTIHMPEVVCLRGTMMLNGSSPCDGRIDPVRCGYCYGVPERIPAWAISRLSQVPQGLSMGAETQLLASKNVRMRQLGRTISIPAQVAAHAHKLQEMAQLADRIVAVCQWLEDALGLNGVPKDKIVLSRHGVSYACSSSPRQKQPDEPLKIGFLGRWQETKGVQVLAEAVCQLPKNIPVQLMIHAVSQGELSRVNEAKVFAMAETDSRIQINKKLSRDQVPEAMKGFDLLAVPSQWLETGPLVVLEAFATQTPVLGSNRGGIAELVEHGVDGWLVEADHVEAWKNAIAQLATDPELLSKLRQGIKPVRTMDDVAQDMTQLYEEILRTSS